MSTPNSPEELTKQIEQPVARYVEESRRAMQLHSQRVVQERPRVHRRGLHVIDRGYRRMTALFVACGCQLEESTTVSNGPRCEMALATVVQVDGDAIRPDHYGAASEDDSACPQQCGPAPDEAGEALLFGCVLRAPRRQDPAGDPATTYETGDAAADTEVFEEDGIRLLDCLWWQSCLHWRSPMSAPQEPGGADCEMCFGAAPALSPLPA